MGAPAWTADIEFVGRHVRLEPLRLAHAGELAEAAADGELWNLAFTSVPHRDDMRRYVIDALDAREGGAAMPFVVRDASGTIIGCTRYYDLAPEVPRLQIGYTWYARRVQRTLLNTEAKRLLFAHAFEYLGCAAVGFETSHLNLRSQAAILRLGATFDGRRRAHMRHRDGSLRDTLVYSVIAEEWPMVRARLDGFLAGDRDD
ncbi:MAG: N-acetyltransferase [Lysobacter sp.]|nr:MAG: N-acetyltransferase [Lysobacter sp.]